MTRAVRHDERELARAIALGASKRPEQAFGHYFVGRRASCALGAAYEGIYRLPAEAGDVRPKRMERFFDCLEGTLRHCPESGCRKTLMLSAMIVHLNDDHHWTRENVVAWLETGEPPTAAAPEEPA
jgi:hypothetical protein